MQSESSDEDILISLFEERSSESNCAKGFVLVNYPETINQLKHIGVKYPRKNILPLFFDIDSEVSKCCAIFSLYKLHLFLISRPIF
jgi:adenylate kinase family enzyme